MSITANKIIGGILCVSLFISVATIANAAATGAKSKSVIKKRVTKKNQQSLINPIKKRWDMQRISKPTIPAGWQVKAGKWEISSEPEHPSNKVLRQIQLKRANQQLVTKADYANFDISVKLRADSFKQKTKNWQMGIMFRMVDDNHYYKCRITAANIALIRYAMENKSIIPASQGTTSVAGATGRRAQPNEQMLLILPIGAPSDQWHTLEVKGYGDRIGIKLNNREIRTLSDVGIGSGKISIFTYKTQAFIDDIKLSYLTIPKMNNAIVPVRKVYSPGKHDGLLIYYQVSEPGIIELSVKDRNGKLFAQLGKNYHAAGINTVVWYGQGLLGSQPLPGRYTLNLNNGKKKAKSTITIR